MSVEEINANQRKLITELQREVTQLTDIYRAKDKRIIELQDELAVARTKLIKGLDAKDKEIEALKGKISNLNRRWEGAHRND